EVLVDPSRSMAVSEERRERPRELAAPSLRLAAVQGLPAALYWLGGAPERCEAPLDEFEGT
ncbi:MAG TPA: hypothetical protein DFS52_07530, partial [Myxococcales bacterium]|nr:hypothetical protein [Myxococcales bacterium]